jgi:hypothetical protein
MKICKDCNLSKEEKDFHTKRQTYIKKSGVKSYSYCLEARCKKCKNKRDTYNKNRSIEMINKTKQYQKEYHKHYL